MQGPKQMSSLLSTDLTKLSILLLVRINMYSTINENKRARNLFSRRRTQWKALKESVLLLPVHDFVLGDAATQLGVECETQHRDGDGYLFVAGHGCRNHYTAGVALSVNNGASVTFRLDAKTDART